MSEWAMKSLGEDGLLLAVHPGFACGRKDITNGVPHLRMNNISKDGLLEMTLIRRIPLDVAETQNRFVEPADILFNNTNSTELVGKSCIFTGWQERCTFSNHLTRLRPNPERLCSEWLFMCLRDLWLQGYFAANCVEFVGQSAFNKDKLLEVKIPVPPLTEQRRLVCRVKALTGRLEQARKARQAAIPAAATFLRAAVARAFEDVDETSLRPLGKLTGIIGGNSIPENAPLRNLGEECLGLMKVSDMNAFGNERFINRCKLETSRAAAVARKLRIVPAGAVVFPKRGGAIATNKKRVLSFPASLDPNLMGVFPLPKSGLISDFLFWWFESLDLAELQEDGGIPQVNKKHLDPLLIPVLSELEQSSIVARLDALRGKLDELLRLQREVDAELAAFTPALLAKAFRGEL